MLIEQYRRNSQGSQSESLKKSDIEGLMGDREHWRAAARGIQYDQQAVMYEMVGASHCSPRTVCVHGRDPKDIHWLSTAIVFMTALPALPGNL